MAATVNDSLQNNSPKSLDNKYLFDGVRPYASITEANTKVIVPYRSQGLTVLIGPYEYWWRDGTLDNQLILKGVPIQVQADWNQTNVLSADFIKNKPIIPAAQVNTDWNSVSGLSQLLNKPNLATVAFTGSYPDLINKPTIPVQFNPIAGTNITITGSYPNMTFNSAGAGGATAVNGLTIASGSVVLGQTVSQVGDPAILLSSREIPTGGFNVVLTGTGKVGIGTNAPSNSLSVTQASALTNTLAYPFRLTHITSGTSTTGFGVGMEIEAENASGTNRVIGSLTWPYSSATNASESASFIVNLMRSGTLAEAIRVTSAGNLLVGRTDLAFPGLIQTFTSNAGNFIGINSINTNTGITDAASMYITNDVGTLEMTLGSSTNTGVGAGLFRIQNKGNNGTVGAIALSASGTNDVLISTAGIVTLNNLSGSGTRMVVASSTGVLSTQTFSVGTVSTFSSGNLSPLFTTSVATATTTPALSFALSNAAANTVFGNGTASSAAPSFFQPILASSLFSNQGTPSQVLHGNNAGNPTWGAVALASQVSGLLPIANGGTGTATPALVAGAGVTITGSWPNNTIAATNTGTVTSVALASFAGISVSGSPITTSGTITLSTTLNGPLKGNGSAFITGLISLTSEVANILPIANGGTNAATANAALNNLLPSQTSQSGKVLTTNGTNTSWTSTSTGTVTSVSMSVPTGLTVSGSPITTAGTFAITTTLNGPIKGNGSGFVAAAINLATSEVTGVTPIANGGTGAASANVAFNNLAPAQTGNSGKILSTDGTNTSWIVNNVGTVTSVALTAFTGITVTGSPITTSGTLALSTTLNGVLHGNGSGFTAGNVSLTSEVTGTLPIANGGTNATTANAAFNNLAPSQTGNNTKILTTDGTNTSWIPNGQIYGTRYTATVNPSPGGGMVIAFGSALSGETMNKTLVMGDSTDGNKRTFTTQLLFTVAIGNAVIPVGDGLSGSNGSLLLGNLNCAEMGANSIAVNVPSLIKTVNAAYTGASLAFRNGDQLIPTRTQTVRILQNGDIILDWYNVGAVVASNFVQDTALVNTLVIPIHVTWFKNASV